MLEHWSSNVRMDRFKNSRIEVTTFSGHYIIYLLPPKVLSDQIKQYWTSTPYTEASMYIPHVSVTGFFSASEEDIEALKAELGHLTAPNVELGTVRIRHHAIHLDITVDLDHIKQSLIHFGKKRHLPIRLKEADHFSLAYRDKKVVSHLGPLSDSECCIHYDCAKHIQWKSNGEWELALFNCNISHDYYNPHSFQKLHSWTIN